MKRKIREKASKVFGTKQVLTQINKAAHEEEHRTPTSGSPTVATFEASYKWGLENVPQRSQFDAWPVGSIFITVDSQNPNALLGYGIWVAFGTGQVLVGIDTGDVDFATVELTGGSKSTTHSHGPGTLTTGGPGATVPRGTEATDAAGPAHGHSVTTGTTATDPTEIVQPFIVVYMWKRTA